MIRIVFAFLIGFAVFASDAAWAGGRDDQRLITGARGKIMPMIIGALNAGADIEARDEIGRTALIWAAFQGHGPMLAYLIDQGADVNARDDRNRTALMWAAIAGRDDAVQTLMAHGADAAAADTDGKTAADHAAHEGHAALVRRLAE